MSERVDLEALERLVEDLMQPDNCHVLLAIAELRRLRGMEADRFAPHWPEGLAQGEAYRVLCDDKGRNGGTWLQVYTGTDGDMWVEMQDWEEMPEGQPSPLPSLRCRTFCGGGQNHRTHQALLWLAQAIRLDNEERQAKYGKFAARAVHPSAESSPTVTVPPAPSS